MTTLAPLTGSPASVRLLADRVAHTGARLASMAAVLGGLRDGAVWDGAAGAAFGESVAAAPTVLDAASRRMLGAVAPLRELASALEDAQAVTTAAQREHADATDSYARLEEHAWALVPAGATEADAAVLVVRARQREDAATIRRAEVRHGAALESYRAADRRCAAALRALVGDGLADPWGYRALAGASGAGHAVGSVGLLGPTTPVAKGVGVVGEAGGTAADVALLGVYDEGSWAELGTAAALSGTAFLGRGLVAGSARGARLGADGARALTRLSARERVVAGTAAEARRRVAGLRRTFDAPDARGTPSALLGGPVVAAARPAPVSGRLRAGAEAARARVRAAADARFLDDWRLATANGTRPMYASGVTLQAAAAAGEQAGRRTDPEPATGGR